MTGSSLPGVRAAVVWTALAVVAVVMASGGVALADDNYRVRPGNTLSGIAAHLGVDAPPGRRQRPVRPQRHRRRHAPEGPHRLPLRCGAGRGYGIDVEPAAGHLQGAPGRHPLPGCPPPRCLGRPTGRRQQPGQPEHDRRRTQPRHPSRLDGPSLPASTGTATITSAAAAAATAPEVASVSPSWQCPVSGAHFVDDYGYVNPDGSRHRGVDLYAPRFAPVVAPVSGVLTPYPKAMGGLAFQLSGNDGNRYYGAHLQSYGYTGQVTAGAVIGLVGNSGDAVGGPTHLHFEIHPGGGPAANPYPALAANCP